MPGCHRLEQKYPQGVQKDLRSHPPTPARQDALFTEQGRSEVRDTKKNERHVCGRARVGERPGSEKARRSHFTRPAPSCF